MTVSSTDSSQRTTGNGVTTSFPTSIKIFQESDLAVQILDTVTNAVINTLILNDAGALGFSVVFDTDAETATVTANTAPLGTEDIFIKRAVPLTQGADYPKADKFPSIVTENGLDKLTVIAQDQAANLSEALTALPSQGATNFTYVDTPIIGRGMKFSTTTGELINTVNDMDDIAVNAAASAAAAAISEGNASTSETNAAASEAAAAASAAAAAAVAINWTFDSSIVMADPLTGNVRLDNATISSVTNIAFSALEARTGNPDVSAFVDTWDDSNNPTGRGFLVIRKTGASDFFIVYNITGNITDNGSWLQVPVTFVDSNGTLSASDDLFFQFTRTGDQGASGAGSGDLLAANNLSDVASAPTSRINLGLQIGVNVQAFDANNAVTNAVQTYTRQQGFGEQVLADGANIAWDLDLEQTATVTLAGNRQLDNPTNMVAGHTYILRVVQDGAGNRTLTYDTAYLFPDGTAFTLSTGGGEVDILTFYSDGTNMYGVGQTNFS